MIFWEVIKVAVNHVSFSIRIFETLSISFDELERRWHQHLKAEITWFTYLIHNLYEILFFLAALITIYAFIKIWMKKRAYSYEED